MTRRRDCWFQRVLPYMEQANMYSAYENLPSVDFVMGEYIHRITLPSIVGPIPAGSCPSDPNSPGKGGNGGTVAFQSNYAVCAGVGTTATVDAVTSTITPTNRDIAAGVRSGTGLFFLDSSTGFRTCTDGSSNTLLMGEGVLRNNTVAAWGDLGGHWGGAPHGAFGFSTAEVPNTSVADRVYSCKATTTPGAPKFAPCENGNAGGLAGRWNFARSYHVGGVQVTLADGSVRFISDNVDRQTYMKVGMAADGLTIGEF